MAKPASPIRCRTALLSSAALAAMSPLGAATAQAQAAPGAFAGSFSNPQVIRGNATVVVNRAPQRDTISITPATQPGPNNIVQAIIDWTPSDVNGTGPINFLPAGSVASFDARGGITDFTLLNRIVPTDTTRAIRFDGTVRSTINDVRGGNVWFYSPGGIIAGAQSVFDVGGLALTSNNIETVGGFFGTTADQTVRFRGPDGSRSAVQIERGAQLSVSNYFAIVAPRVVQAGSITTSGTGAIIAGEQVNIRIGFGLFDIGFIEGTTAGRGAIEHSGSTTGTLLGTGLQRIYVAAYPKNDAVTMLLGGTLGYDRALVAGASLENGAVVLSSGRGAGDLGIASPLELGASPIANDLLIGEQQTGPVTFASSVIAGSTGNIIASPSAGSTINFAQSIDFTAENRIELGAASGESITIGSNAILQTGQSPTAETFIYASHPAGATTTPGSLTIGGTLQILSNIGVGTPRNPGRGRIVVDGGTIRIGGPVFAGAGTSSRLIGGNYTIDISGPTASLEAQSIELDAEGVAGRFSTDSATGGVARVSISGGSLTAGSLNLRSSANGGLKATAVGGQSAFNVTGGTVTLGNLTITANAGLVGEGFEGDKAAEPATPAKSLALTTASLTGGTASLTVTNTALTLTGDLSFRANADPANSIPSPGDIVGGTVNVTVNPTGSLNIGGTLNATAFAIGQTPSGPDSTDISRGGAITIAASGGPITAGALNLSTDATGFSSLTRGGAAIGGTTTITATANRFETIGASFVSASGTGGSGLTGGAGTGGTVNAIANGGTLALNGTTTLVAAGIGGNATSVNGAFNNDIGIVGGAGTGGTINLRTGTLGGPSGTFTFGTLLGGALGLVDTSFRGVQISGATGGAATGGTVTIDVNNGLFNGNIIDLSASGTGGNGTNEVGSSGASGGGDGTGGTLAFNFNGGTTNVNQLLFTARGNGGSAGLAATEAGYGSNLAPGPGGIGRGGTSTVNLRVAGATINTVRLDTSGTGNTGGGSTSTTGGAGGSGIAGSGRLKIDQDPVFGSVSIINDAVGGAGGIGITGGAGGDALNTAVSAIDHSFGPLEIGTATLSARATGGAGGAGTNGNGGAGGNARGGTARLLVQGPTSQATVTTLTAQADAVGGSGGASAGAGAPRDGGNGGTATGGIVTLMTTTGARSAVSTMTLNANATGGNGGLGSLATTPGGNGGAGGSATAGQAMAIAPGGQATARSVLITASAFGGSGGNGGGNAAVGNIFGLGGNGASGTGGLAQLSDTVISGSDSSVTINANGRGGAGGDGSVGGAGGAGNGGSGTGGAIAMLTAGTSAIENSLNLRSLGTGGAGGQGITGAGGNGGAANGGLAMASIINLNTALTADTLLIASDALAGAGGTGRGGGTGGAATGGSARISATGTAATFTTSQVTALASGGAGGAGVSGGTGGSDNGAAGGAGGSARAGTAAVLADGATANLALGNGQIAATAAGGVGGVGGSGLGSGAGGTGGRGGDGGLVLTGGTASATVSNGGTLRLGGGLQTATPFAILGWGRGGTAGAPGFGTIGQANGGFATGGSAAANTVLLDVGLGTLTGNDIRIDATANGHVATGGTATFALRGGTVTAGAVTIDASASADAIATGGTAQFTQNVQASGYTGAAVTLIANGNGVNGTVAAPGGGNGFGGTASLLINEGLFSATAATAEANATGGIGFSVGDAGGNARGGTARFAVEGGVTGLTLPTYTGTAIARGGAGGVSTNARTGTGGTGGTGIGGVTEASFGATRAAPAITIDSSGFGGSGGLGSDGGIGGNGGGGTATVTLSASATNATTITIANNGTGGQGGFALVGAGGNAGIGTGGTINLITNGVAGTTNTLTALGITATGTGGAGAARGGLGGAATGGQINLSANGTSLTATQPVTFDARATGGAGGAAATGANGARGGAALGGGVTIIARDGGAFAGQALAATVTGTGGRGGNGGGTAALPPVAGPAGNGANGGNGVVGGSAGGNGEAGLAGAAGIVGGVGGNGGIGGRGTGGTVTLQVVGGTITGDATDLTAAGVAGRGGDGANGGNGGAGQAGGNGGNGGNGAAGVASLTIGGNGGDGGNGGAGGAGGNGGSGGTGGDGGRSGESFGGTVLIDAQGGVIRATNLIATADGRGVERSQPGLGGIGGAGGAGGNAGTGGAGGAGGFGVIASGRPGAAGTAGALGTNGSTGADGSTGMIGPDGGSAGGSVTLALAPSGGEFGTVEFGSTTLGGSAFNGFGATEGGGGTVVIRNANDDPAAPALRLTNLFARATGTQGNAPNNGVTIDAGGSALIVDGSVDIQSSDSITVRATGEGNLQSVTDIRLDAGTSILISHNNQPGTVRTISGRGIELTAQDSIAAGFGTQLQSSTRLALLARGGSITVDDVRAIDGITAFANTDVTFGSATTTGIAQNGPNGLTGAVIEIAAGNPDPIAGAAIYNPANARIRRSLTATGAITINAGSDVIIDPDAALRSDNFISVSSGDDVIVGDGASLTSAINVAANTGYGFLGNANLNVGAGSIATNGADPADIASFIAGDAEFRANGRIISINAEAIAAPRSRFFAEQFVATIANAPALGAVAGDDQGQLLGDCVEGNVCLGSVSSTDLVTIGAENGTVGVPNRIIVSGNLAGRTISMRANGDVTLGSLGETTSIIADDRLFASSINGNIDIVTPQITAGLGGVALFSAGSINGGATVITSEGNVGLGANGGVTLLSLATQGVLNTILDNSAVTESGLFTTPGGFTITDTLRVTGGDADIRAAGGIDISTARLGDTADLRLDAGTNNLRLGATGPDGQSLGPVDVQLSGNDVTVDSIIALGNISVGAQNSLIATGTLTASNGLNLTSVGDITLADASAAGPALVRGGGRVVLNALSGQTIDVRSTASGLTAGSLTAVNNLVAYAHDSLLLTNATTTGGVSNSGNLLFGGAMDVRAGVVGGGVSGITYRAADLTINGTLTSTGGLQLVAGRDVLINDGARILTDNFASISAGDDILMFGNVTVNTARNAAVNVGYGAFDPIAGFTGTAGVITATGLDPDEVGSFIADNASFASPNNSVLISGNAVQARGSTISGGTVTVTIADAPPQGGQPNTDGGQLVSGCTAGNLCLGSIQATDRITLGGGANDTRVTGSLSAPFITITGRESVLLGEDGRETLIDAGNELIVTTEGLLSLLGTQQINAGSATLFAGASITGNLASVSAVDLLNLGASSITLANVTTGGRLQTIDGTNVITKTDGLEVTGSLSFGSLSVGDGVSLIAGDQVQVEFASAPVVDITTPGSARLGNTGAVGSIRINGGVISLGDVAANGDIALESSSEITIDTAVRAASRLLANALGGAITGGAISADLDVELTANTQVNVGNVTSDNGNINISATGPITTADLSTPGGSISLSNQSGAITAGTISARDDFSLTTGNDIVFAGVSVGDDISITTQGSAALGRLTTTGGGTDDEGNGNNITLSSLGAMSVVHANSSGNFSANANSFVTGTNTIITAGDIDIVTLGDAVLGNSRAGGSIRVNAGGLIEFNAIESVALTNLTAAGLIGGTSASANGFGASAGTSINIGTITSTGGLTLASANGELRIGTGTAGGSIILSQGGASALLATALTSNGNITASAAGNVAIGTATTRPGISRPDTGPQGDIFIVAQGTASAETLTAVRSIGVTGSAVVGTGTWTAGEDVFVTTPGAVTLATVSAGDNINVTAAGDITIADATTTGAITSPIADRRQVALVQLPQVAARVFEVQASAPDGADIVLTSTAGAIDATRLSAADDIFATARSASRLGFAATTGLSVETGSGAAPDGSNINVAINEGLTFTTGAAANNLTITAQSISAGALGAGGVLRANLTQGGQIATASGTNLVDITSGTALGVDLATSTGGDVLITTATGALEVGAASAARDLRLTATDGNLSLARTASSGRDTAYTASGSATLASTAAGATLAITSGGPTQYTTLTSGTSTTIGAGGAINGGDVTAGTTLTLTGASTDVGALVSSGAMTVTTTGLARIGSATAGPANGNMMNIAPLTINADEIITGNLSSSSAALTALRSIAFANINVPLTIAITAGADVTGGGITTAGSTQINAGRNMALGSLFSLGAFTAEAGNAARFDQISLTGPGQIRAGAGGIALGTAGVSGPFDLTAAGPITASGLLAVRNSRLTASGGAIALQAVTAGAITLTSASTLSAANLSATGSDINLTSVGAITTGDLTAANGSVSLTNTNGDLTTGAITVRNDFTVNTASNVTFGGVSAGDDIRITTSGAATLGRLSTATSGTDNETDGRNIVLSSGGRTDLVSANAAGNFSATAARFETGLNTIIAAGDIIVGSSGEAILGNATAGGRIVATAGGAIGFATITAGQSISLTAATAITGAAGDAANSFTSIARGGATSIGSITAGSDIIIDSTGAVTLSSARNNGVARPQVAIGEGIISIISDGAVTLGTAAAGSSLGVAGTQITSTGAWSAAEDVVANGTGIALAAVTAGDDIIASAGTVTLRDATAGGRGNDARSLVRAPLPAPNPSTGQAQSNTARRFALSTTTPDGADIRISASGAVTTANLTAADDIAVRAGGPISTGALSAPGGNITLINTAGALTTGTIAAGGDLDVETVGPVDFASIVVGDDVRITTSSTARVAALRTTGPDRESDGSNIVIRSGALTIGTADAFGNLTITAPTLSATTLRSGNNLTATIAGALTADLINASGARDGSSLVTLTATSGIGVARLGVTGDAALSAVNGAVAVTTDHAVSGTTDAIGQSVNLVALGGVGGRDITATDGNLVISAGGTIALANGRSRGDIRLGTTAGDIVAGTLLTGTSVGVATSSAAGPGDIILTATRNLTLSGNTDARGALRLAAGGLATVSSLGTAASIDVRAANVAIAANAQLGTQGRTTAVTFTNTANTQTTIGGAGTTTGFSLSNAELARVQSGDIIINAPRVSATPTNGGQVSAALNSRTPDVILDTLTLSAGATGNIGASGRLRIVTPGKLRTVGAVTLNGLGTGNRFEIVASETIEVDAATGSITLLGSGGVLGGTLDLSSEDVIAASLSAIGDVALATNIQSIDERLRRNDGAVNNDGVLRAGGIVVRVSNGFFVQNTGANSGNPRNFDDRRGLTVNTGGLTINTTLPTTSIVINGQSVTPSGQFVTGLDFLREVSVNNASIGQGTLGAGQFFAGSTINGCEILNIGSCQVSFNDSARDIIVNSVPGGLGAMIEDDFVLSLVELRDVDSLPGQPIIDEPVTGAGNDDLWISGDVAPCSSTPEGCAKPN